MNIKTTLKASVAAAALFAIAAPVTTTANAADDTFTSGNKNSLTMSGFVARGLYWADNGTHSGLFNTAGETATSRVRWVASAEYSKNVSVGALLEYEVPHSNDDASAKLDFEGNVTNGDKTAWTIRRENIWIKHKTMGKITLGQATEPSDGGWRANFAKNGGTGAAMDFEHVNGATQFLNGTSITGVTVDASRDEINAGGAADVIRYDLPSLPGGLVVGIAMNSAGIGTINGAITGKTGAVTTKVGIGFKDTSANSTTDEYKLSLGAGLLHDSGFHVGVAIGQQPAETVSTTVGNKSHIGVIAGFNTETEGVGPLGIYLGWSQSKNTDARGSVGTTMAFNVAQYFDAIGATMALSYRNHSYENERLSRTAVSDVDTLGIQTVFNF